MKVFNQREMVERRRVLRKTQTETEAFLWDRLRGGRCGVRFRRQYGVGKYVVDFYAPKARLVIEIDGDIHEVPDVRIHDKDRQKNIEALGLRFLRFTTAEILGNIEAVLSQIHFSVQNPLLAKERAG
ncbi:MAG: endonuclease domain-containing protein [Patescibacteria group bacterium]